MTQMYVLVMAFVSGMTRAFAIRFGLGMIASGMGGIAVAYCVRKWIRRRVAKMEESVLPKPTVFAPPDTEGYCVRMK